MSEAKQTAKLALEALEDKKAMDVRILDITHVSTLADYFMIASGSNRNQVQAMADNVALLPDAGCLFCAQAVRRQ